jgi:hypothetical protein
VIVSDLTHMSQSDPISNTADFNIPEIEILPFDYKETEDGKVEMLVLISNYFFVDFGNSTGRYR